MNNNQSYISSLIPVEESRHSKPKRIKIWINNDANCHRILLDPRDLQTWHSILNYVTQVIKPSFGAIKSLISLKNLNPVTSFEILDPNEKYVALGYSSVLKTGEGLYKTQSETDQSRTKDKKLYYVGEFDTNCLPFLKVTKKHNLTIVYMVLNGKNENPLKVVFRKADLKDWSFVRNYVTKVMGIAEGVQFICTVFGEPLHKPEEFQHGCLYVVVPFYEKFIAMDYTSSFGDRNKIKLLSSPIPEKITSLKEITPKKKKKVFSPYRSYPGLKKNREVIKRQCFSQEIGADSDFYRNEEMQVPSKHSAQNLASLDISDKGPSPSIATIQNMDSFSTLAGLFKNHLEEETNTTKPGADLNENDSYENLPPVVIRRNKKRNKKALPVIETRILNLSKTIKKYEKKLKKLELKYVKKELEEEEESKETDEEDIFETHHYKNFCKNLTENI